MGDNATSAYDLAVAAREGSRILQRLSSSARSDALRRVAAALVEHEPALLAANEKDLAAAPASLPPATFQRLKLKEGKCAQLAKGIESLAAMEEPLGRTLRRTEVAQGLELQQVTSALGVLLIIFEARPDALPQIAALALRSGNGLVLKGGREARHSNAALHKVITDALAPDVPPSTIALVESREDVADLLKLDAVIDLVIPRGSNELVSYIQANTKIPVLGHADGVCHIYVDPEADMDMAKRILVDAKVDYPAACNAVETVLLHASLVRDDRAREIIGHLEKNGITLYGGAAAAGTFGLPPAPALHHEYGDLQATIEIVQDMDEAIDYIHKHGSSHSECIITSNEGTAETFLSRVDSAAVLWNASTRFVDGFRFGLGAEVGISTSRIHARGPVGVEGLLTTRWLVRGNGQVVEKDRNIAYTHISKPLT